MHVGTQVTSYTPTRMLSGNTGQLLECWGPGAVGMFRWQDGTPVPALADSNGPVLRSWSLAALGWPAPTVFP